MNSQTMQLPCVELLLQKNDELLQRIAALMQIRLGWQLRDFKVATREDGLILSGNAKTYYGKLMAQEVVSEVSGRLILANNIQVKCGGTA